MAWGSWLRIRGQKQFPFQGHQFQAGAGSDGPLACRADARLRLRPILDGQHPITQRQAAIHCQRRQRSHGFGADGVIMAGFTADHRAQRKDGFKFLGLC